MNLVAKEYVAAQAGGNGVLVLSEFAGAARELTDAILVNPWDPDAIARAIEAAVTMPIEERRERLARLLERVTSCDAHWWATAFLTLLARPGPATLSWRPAGSAHGRLAAMR
jgi:trehalose-6-phosphate synthase